jgi:hypothetical protein
VLLPEAADTQFSVGIRLMLSIITSSSGLFIMVNRNRAAFQALWRDRPRVGQAIRRPLNATGLAPGPARGKTPDYAAKPNCGKVQSEIVPPRQDGAIDWCFVSNLGCNTFSKKFISAILKVIFICPLSILEATSVLPGGSSGKPFLSTGGTRAEAPGCGERVLERWTFRRP